MLTDELQSTRKLVHGLEAHVARQRHIAESIRDDSERTSAIAVLHFLEATLATHQDRLDALRRLSAGH